MQSERRPTSTFRNACCFCCSCLIFGLVLFELHFDCFELLLQRRQLCLDLILALSLRLQLLTESSHLFENGLHVWIVLGLLAFGLGLRLCLCCLRLLRLL